MSVDFGFVLSIDLKSNHNQPPAEAGCWLGLLPNSTTSLRRPPGPCRGPAECFMICGSRLINDSRYGSFIIFGLPGKLQKASAYFLFSKEKIKELSLLKWSEIRKLGDRQSLLWSSFLTMSFFSKRGKKTC